FETPDAFFARFFVWNYCPLVFMEASGKNRTPDKLPAHEREALFAPCDLALRLFAEHLGPKLVIGVGAFAAERIPAAPAGGRYRFGVIPHPSPASPTANKGWAKQAEAALVKLGMEL